MFLNEVFEQMGICAEYIDCQEFDTLGLVQNDGCGKMCTFIDTDEFSYNLSENICIILTTKELSQKLVTNGCSLCILENPRKIFFQLHNYLSRFNSTLRNGLEIGDKVRINMGAVVTKNVKSGEHVTGNFAIPHDVFIKNIRHFSSRGYRLIPANLQREVA